MAVKQNPQTGKFVSNHLSTERAREIANLRWSREKQNRVEKLLREAGYDPQNTPEHVRILAERASSRYASSVSALRFFLALTGNAAVAAEEPAPRQPMPGELCPTCNHFVLPDEAFAKLLAILKAAKRSQDEQQPQP